MTRSEMATQSSVITSGVEADKRSFTWKIKNFAVVHQSSAFISSQQFRFSAGESIGLPTNWSCYLNETGEGEDKPIGIFFQLLKKPVKAREVNVSYTVTVKGPGETGNDFFHRKVSLRNMAAKPGSGWGFAKVVPANQKEKVPLVDGHLVIDIDFTVYASTLEPACGKLEIFKTKSLSQLSQDLCEVDTLAGASANFVTKIFSKEGIEFPANRGILSARSPVFQRMFATKMSEAITGEVKIDDISGKTLNVLLCYIYTGTLHPDWNESAEVIEELTYAARKYDLGLLTEFLEGDLLEEEVEEEGQEVVVEQRECNTNGNPKKGLNLWQRILGKGQK